MVKFSLCLNRRVFVMLLLKHENWSLQGFTFLFGEAVLTIYVLSRNLKIIRFLFFFFFFFFGKFSVFGGEIFSIFE